MRRNFSKDTTIISEDDYALALYSVNKRAKNYRDKAREYSHWYSVYNYDKKAKEKEEEYYNLKEKLLVFIKRICIHKEYLGYQKKRVYSYEKNFNKHLINALFNCNICWSNSYPTYSDFDIYDYDDYMDFKDTPRIVDFFDEIDRSKPIINYYLFYVVGDYSFHTPITYESISELYSDIPVISIDRIVTAGKDITDLVSVQYVKKVLNALENGAKLDCKCCTIEGINELRECLEDSYREEKDNNNWFNYWQEDLIMKLYNFGFINRVIEKNSIDTSNYYNIKDFEDFYNYYKNLTSDFSDNTNDPFILFKNLTNDLKNIDSRIKLENEKLTISCTFIMYFLNIVVKNMPINITDGLRGLSDLCISYMNLPENIYIVKEFFKKYNTITNIELKLKDIRRFVSKLTNDKKYIEEHNKEKEAKRLQKLIRKSTKKKQQK